jgi:hypothetical protein
MFVGSLFRGSYTSIIIYYLFVAVNIKILLKKYLCNIVIINGVIFSKRSHDVRDPILDGPSGFSVV